MKEDIKTILDICQLNQLRDLNENSILSKDEKDANDIVINRKLRDKTRVIPKLELDKEKVDHVNKTWQTYISENKVIVT